MATTFVARFWALAISSAAVGYLSYRVIDYHRAEKDFEIEQVLATRGEREGKPGTSDEKAAAKDPTGTALKEKEIGPEKEEPAKPESIAPVKEDGKEREKEEEEVVRVLPPGRVSGALPDRAKRAAAVVLPELEPALRVQGLKVGDPIFIRIFKAERELELWVFHEGDGRYRLFKTYRVAGMSGRLGPKLAEGDFQAPEGFYYVDRGRMNPTSAFHLSFDLGFPNVYDLAHGRTGSYLMVHGSTVSAGCFAMTDYGIEEIYSLADAALSGGEKFFRAHIFPFRMTDEAMAEAAGHRWFAFWENLREGYLYFERNGRPPNVSVANQRYVFTDEADFR